VIYLKHKQNLRTLLLKLETQELNLNKMKIYGLDIIFFKNKRNKLKTIHKPIKKNMYNKWVGEFDHSFLIGHINTVSGPLKRVNKDQNGI
jgi:tryptophan synthase beta subunit